MSWTYKGQPVTDDSQFPKDAIGFIYRINRISDGKTYIGKKLIFFSKTSTKTITLKSGIKKKKKIKSLVPSDWKTYWSSSENLVKEVETLGESAFTREILIFCANKGSLGYYEARYQMDERLLEIGERSWNGILSCRIHRSHVKPIIEPASLPVAPD